jgi:hypothetical protein
MTYWQWLRQFGGLKKTWVFYAFVTVRTIVYAISGDGPGVVVFVAGAAVVLTIHLLIAWDVYRRARRYHQSIGDADPITE